MDQCMVSLGRSGPPFSVGDEVLLFGEAPGGSGATGSAGRPPSPGDAALMAEKLGTIPYEILCGISRRVPRVYLG
jgi:alanine racemase